MGSLERKITRNALKKHVKEEEEKYNVKGRKFSKYWQDFKKRKVKK